MPKYVHKNRNTDVAENALLWVAMLPLLRPKTLRLHVQCESSQSAFLELHCQVENMVLYSDDQKQGTNHTIAKQRFWLRRRLEGLEKSRNGFVKSARS